LISEPKTNEEGPSFETTGHTRRGVSSVEGVVTVGQQFTSESARHQKEPRKGRARRTA